MEFDSKKAIRRYAELMRLTGFLVYPEGDFVSDYYEDFDIGKAIIDLEEQAARFGFKFVVDKSICRIEPMTEEEKAAHEWALAHPYEDSQS